MNATRSACSRLTRAAKRLRAVSPWPSWARIASRTVLARPSWRKLVRIRRPRAGPSASPGLRRRLRDPVVQAPHVVEQEVGEGEEDDVVQRRDRVGTGLQGGDMAVGAADRGEQGRPVRASRGAGRWGGGARNVVWSASCITVAVVSLGLLRAGLAASRAGPPRAVLVGEERGRDAHLVEEGVAGEGEDRADLALPAEPADPRLTAEDIGHDVGPAGRRGGEVLLELGDRP